jgi:hypothetical protein
MVYINEVARKDLYNILVGLANWEKHPLELEHAEEYVDDITDICYTLDSQLYHANTVYPIHKCYGSKVYKYKRNPNTTWYIIYNLDKYDNVFVNKIISNHLTHLV